MYHSIYFTTDPWLLNYYRSRRRAVGQSTLTDAQKNACGAINTWDDWHLIPSMRPVFVPPQKKTNFLDIPGGNGLVDLSEALTGYPTYNNREGTMEFYMANDYGDWAARRTEVAEYLHNHSLIDCVLEDDPGYYYEGFIGISEWPSEKNWGRIVFSYNVKPYKYNVNAAGDNWLWDPFNFETGYISSNKFYSGGNRNNWQITLSGGSETIIIPGSLMPVAPILIVTLASGNSITARFTYGNKTTTQTFSSSGAYRFSDNIPQNTSCTILLSGTGTVKLEYRGGTI